MLLSLLAAASWVALAPTGFSSPDGDRLVRVATPTAEAREHLAALGLDVWTEHPRPDFADVRVPSAHAAWLEASGLDYVVLQPDLGPAVRDERERLATHGPYQGGGSGPFFEDYQPLESIEARLGELAEAATLDGTNAATHILGPSLEGRSIRSLEITEADADAPVILINAGQHAREWISVASAMCVADRLVTEAASPRVAALLTEVRFAVVPVVNPDGYVFSWTEDRLWRKNRRPPNGVDTNRNFGVAWGGPGSSGNPEAGNYRGEAPFSEPEAQALGDYAQSFPNLAGHLDVHAYGQLVLYPWGFQDEEPDAIDVLRGAAEAYEDGLQSPHDTDYVSIPGAALYPAAGNVMDWSFGELGVFALGVELRPDGDQDPEMGFVLPPEQILPVCDEVWEATLNFAEFVAAQTNPGPGDDGRASADDSTGGPGDHSGDEGGPPAEGTTSTSGAGVGTGGAVDPTTGGSATTESQAEADESGARTTFADADAQTDDGGCACQTSRRASSTVWGLLVLGLFGLRRRRARRRPR